MQARRAARDAGLTGQDLEAAIEATVLAAALAAQRLGRQSSNTAVVIDAPDQGGPDLAGEVAWLEKVAAAFASPLVPCPHVAGDRPPERPENDTCPI